MRSGTGKEWEEHYQKIRKAEDPPTFFDKMNEQPDELLDRSAMAALTNILADGNVGRGIHLMKWHVIDTSEVDFDFMTSDRPLIRTNGLFIDGGHIALPIAPRKLFIAARDEATLSRLLSISKRQMVREVNRQVCTYAARYVWGVDDSQIDYVSKHFATKEQPRIVNTTVEQRQKMVERMKPPSSFG